MREKIKEYNCQISELTSIINCLKSDLDTRNESQTKSKQESKVTNTEDTNSTSKPHNKIIPSDNSSSGIPLDTTFKATTNHSTPKVDPAVGCKLCAVLKAQLNESIEVIQKLKNDELQSQVRHSNSGEYYNDQRINSISLSSISKQSGSVNSLTESNQLLENSLNPSTQTLENQTQDDVLKSSLTENSLAFFEVKSSLLEVRGYVLELYKIRQSINEALNASVCLHPFLFATKPCVLF